MKRIFIVTLFFLAGFGAFSQTAVNFSVKDCAGVNHTLFDELDAGKVIVLCWVMPCSSCVGTTLTTYNVAQSFAVTYPGRVNMYIVDDYANTNCTSLNSWCNANGFTNTARFSNAAIKMSDYGTAGMPKVVVIGNYTHHVYYNANNTVNATLLSTAITAALQDFSVGLENPGRKEDKSLRVFPNPVNRQASLSFTLENAGSVRLSILTSLGEQAIKPERFMLGPGEQTISLPAADLRNGIYFARLETDSGIRSAKFVVSHD